MAKVAKRIGAARASIDRDKLYSVDEAVSLVKQNAKAKFDETIEIAINLNVDPRHADQTVRGMNDTTDVLAVIAPREARVAVTEASVASALPDCPVWLPNPSSDHQSSLNI